jgi:lipopolysaccharide biosynthesis glycosyltransferase
MIRVFIGYDSKVVAPWHVLTHSILSRSSAPVSFVPLAINNLSEVLWRERNPLQSTEFSFSRFLTPYLSGYEGWSLFLDNDMLFQDDIAKLWALRDEKYAAMCVKHAHQPKETTKFLGARQTTYQKKNWSSVVLFNNSRCKSLTPEYVNTASGLDLHQFKWLASDNEIGALPCEWNHLVGYDTPAAGKSNIHYTLGGPFFSEHEDCEYGDEWRAEKQTMLKVDQLVKTST